MEKSRFVQSAAASSWKSYSDNLAWEETYQGQIYMDNIDKKLATQMAVRFVQTVTAFKAQIAIK